MLELLLEHLELLGLRLDVFILVHLLLVFLANHLLLWNVLFLNVQSMHLLVDVTLMLLLAVNHLLIRLKAHMRNPAVRIGHQPVPVVLVGVQLGA